MLPSRAPRLTWGELWMVLGIVVFLLTAPMVVRFSESSGFYTGFWFAWMMLAAFVGLAPALIRRTGSWRPLGASLLILGSVGVCLWKQHFFSSVSARNWLVSVAAIVALVSCVPLARRLPRPARRLALLVTHAAWLCSVLWMLASPCHIFIPVLFMPDESLASWRMVFGLVFGGVAMVAGWLAWRMPVSDEAESGAGLAAEISRRAKWRLLLGGTGFLVVAGFVLYLVPGTCSGSGRLAAPRPLSASPVLGSEVVIRYLRDVGCENDASEVSFGAPFDEGQEQLVTRLFYPLASGRGVHIGVFANGVVSYRFGGVSMRESREVRDFTSEAQRGLMHLLSKAQEWAGDPS